MMKRYLTMLIALVAIATGAKAATGYGFKINDIDITSLNHEVQSDGKPWYYDPENNVLHLTDGILESRANRILLYVRSDVNPTLTIQVDGDFKTQFLRNYAIEFMGGGGKHTICGEGTLTLEPELINIQGLIHLSDNTKLTIKDLTLNINSYGSGDSGFVYGQSSEIILDNCELNIKSGFKAWNGFSEPTLINCHLSNGIFYEGEAYKDTNRNEILKELHVKRLLRNFNITVNEPVSGGTVSNSCQFNGTGCEVESVEWHMLLTGGNSSYIMNEGSEFQPGLTYYVYIRILANDGERIASREDCVATINGKPAEIYNSSDNFVVLYYTFPQIPDTFYDLWVSDQQVKESNRNALPTTSGTCSYDPVTKTLTLNSAQITNTDYNIEGTVSGFGIYSNIDGLTINLVGNNYINSTHWVGLFSMRNLTITGNGKLFIEANSGGTGLAMGSYGYKLNITGGVKVDAYGGYGVTGGIHTVNVGGEELIESYVTTLSVSSPNAELRAYGTQQCVKDIPFLGEGMEFICENNPNVKLYHKNWSICYYERSRYFPYSNDWIKMTNPNGGISTGLEAIDNEQLTMDNSLPLYNLQGQRVSHPVKGQIYIQNGRKVKF